jgi:dihydrofolate reductase
MRNIIASEMITLDGYFAGPNGEIDWHVVNDEFFADAVALLDSVDTLLYGRETYQGMLGYWTSPAAIEGDAVIAEKMNTTPKIVFSKTLDHVEWGKWDNARLANGDIAEEVRILKQQPGKDMVIYGSGSIVSALTQLGLIDDYRLFIVPIVLGNGKPLFKGITTPAHLKLTEAKTYKTGVAVLRYEKE